MLLAQDLSKAFVPGLGEAAYADTLKSTTEAMKRLNKALAERVLQKDFVGKTIGGLVSARGEAMIDPFDQPVVEEARLLAKKYLGEGR